MINFITAGESHGKGIVVILEGIPSGLKLSIDEINKELMRRKKGYGRGKRMEIEQDKAEIISGVRFGETIGSPICMIVYNKDYRKQDFVVDTSVAKLKSIDKGTERTVTSALGFYKSLQCPRPGHADLSGAIKFLRSDLKDISERSSARETVGRVIAGSVCKQMLLQLNIFVGSFVTSIHKIDINIDYFTTENNKLLKFHNLAEKSVLRVPDVNSEKRMIKVIDEAILKKDTVGGEFVTFSVNNPVGLGSYTQWNERLDAKIAFSMMSIPAIKSVEIGLGKVCGEKFGSEVHDEIYYSSSKLKVKGLRFFRKTNNAGGIEGGISNGEPIIVKCTMKPIPTLGKPLKTVNIKTKKSCLADIVRSDVVAVSACSIIAESMLAVTLANEIKIKFGGNSMKELVNNYKNYIYQIQKF